MNKMVMRRCAVPALKVVVHINIIFICSYMRTSSVHTYYLLFLLLIVIIGI